MVIVTVELSTLELRQQLLAYYIVVCLCLGQTQWFDILLLRHLPTFILNFCDLIRQDEKPGNVCK